MRENSFPGITRRDFLKSAALGTAAAAAAGIPGTACLRNRKVFLLRYDTEAMGMDMTGFFEKIVSVHRADQIPATFFCLGVSIDNRRDAFADFFTEIQNDPLFDIQDHSYSHLGLGYEDGNPVDVLRADYERSFELQEQVFGTRPAGIAICGTNGIDGPRLSGFDETEKSLAEFHMVAELGVTMINTFLMGIDESREFTSYASIGHPDIMGFPSSYSDTSWMWQEDFGDPMEYILSQINERGRWGVHMPLMLHDWVAWNYAPDRELTHVRIIAEHARSLGYEMLTHRACYDENDLWR